MPQGIEWQWLDRENIASSRQTSQLNDCDWTWSWSHDDVRCLEIIDLIFQMNGVWLRPNDWWHQLRRIQRKKLMKLMHVPGLRWSTAQMDLIGSLRDSILQHDSSVPSAKCPEKSIVLRHRDKLSNYFGDFFRRSWVRPRSRQRHIRWTCNTFEWSLIQFASTILTYAHTQRQRPLGSPSPSITFTSFDLVSGAQLTQPKRRWNVGWTQNAINIRFVHVFSLKRREWEKAVTFA